MAEPPAAAVTADEQRRQLLTKRVTTVNKLRREICDRRNNLPSVTQSRGIPVPLFPKESWLKYTQRFERWLAKRGQSLAALRNDPSKERNYWFSYAYLRVGPIDTEVDAFGRKRSYSYTSSLQYEPESKRLRRDINDGVEKSRQLWGLEAADARLATRCAAAYSGEEQSRQLLSLSLSELTQASLPRVRIEQHAHDGKLSGKNFSHCNDQTSPAPLLVDSGLKRQLVEEYKHLNNLIMTNETAVNDALEFAKTIKEVDDVQAMENQREMIMELVVAINQKKEQRTSALAALITCSWTGDEESLVSLLKEDSTPPECVKHEELAAVLTQMEMKTKEMGHLEEQLSDQTPLVRAFNPFVMEAGKALQDKKIQEVSVRLSKEKQAKGELEKECRRMLMYFLQSDAEVRKLVKQSLV
ncbi:hypothetical protein PF010_g5 [Phytophthora fragariae]|uniref:Uncharacterized protein n=1 Tax=Phytophthora fragariae TaxID=53985 RepID=A0A6G0M4Y9_9STRA|nr:hypothetical protein PF010_g5 [Phytophthora fragariae]